MYVLLSLPAFCLLFQYTLGIKNYRLFFDSYVKKETNCKPWESDSVFILALILGSLGFLAICYSFYHIGSFPLWEYIKGNKGILNEREVISRGFAGSQYIRNIFALCMVPNLSYLAYAYMRVTKQVKWRILFFALFVLSIICKTYDFEKAPVILYVFYFYLIEVLLGRIKSIKLFLAMAVGAVVFIIFIYIVVFGYSGNLISISTGPLARIIMTQIATCFLHVEAFPRMVGFLKGSSFPTALAWMFGSNESWIRSGRIVMELFGTPTASGEVTGAMNSLFVAEAYANFGMGGVVFAPILIAFFITVVPNIILMIRKDPINISLYVIITSSYIGTLTGGFVDFFYNVDLVFIVLLFSMVKLFVNNGNWRQFADLNC